MAKKKARKKKAAKRKRVVSPPKKKRTHARTGEKEGKPRFKPTDEQRKHVAIISGLGLRQDQICLLVENPYTGKPIDEKTLRLYFSAELEVGVAEAHKEVAQSLYDKATGDGNQAVTAAIWYSKCRMGWKERQVVEIESKSGVLIAPAAISPEEWIAAAQAANKGKMEPGVDD